MKLRLILAAVLSLAPASAIAQPATGGDISDIIYSPVDGMTSSMVSKIGILLPYVVTIFTLLVVISLAFRMFRRYARG